MPVQPILSPARFFSFLVLFGLLLSFLFFFVSTTAWYEPARLVIKGSCAATDETVTVEWDSGAGYNEYEQVQFHFFPQRIEKGRKLRVMVAGGTQKNSVSKSGRIILSEIRVDDKGLYIPETAMHSVRHVKGQGWVFDSVDSRISLLLPMQERLYFFFKTSSRAGMVRIFIDSVKTEHDLYRGNWEVLKEEVNFWFLDRQGNFTVSLEMPRYGMERMRITGGNNTLFSSVFLKTGSGKTINLPFHDQDGTLLVRPGSLLKHHFHPNRIVWQFVFALLMTWLSWGVMRFVVRSGGLREFLFGRQLRLFWLFFTGSTLVYGAWLIIFWPGVMSVDSLNIWRAAWLPDVMINNHPLLNVLWYTFLLHFWNNIAVVPVAQILLLSLLIGSTLSFCQQQGVALRWLLPCWLLLLTSLPMGLYSVTLWKDVPFALLVVFWSLAPVYFFQQRRRGKPVRITVSQLLALLLLFLALLLFRHNGMVYLFTLPLLLIGLKLVPVSRRLLLCSSICAALLTALVIFPPKSMKSASYFHDLSQSYLQQFVKEDPGTRLQRAAVQYSRLLDLKKNDRVSDFWHYFLGDRYAYIFLKQSGWNDSHKYARPDALVPGLRAWAMKIYKKSLDYPWIYCSWNPFWLLYLFPLSLLLCRWFPLSAIFSSVILVQVLALLLFVNTMNWRYYYFVLCGGYFILPIILLDMKYLMNHEPETHTKNIGI